MKIKTIALVTAVIAALLLGSAVMPPSEAFAKSRAKKSSTRVAKKKVTKKATRRVRVKRGRKWVTVSIPVATFTPAPAPAPAPAVVSSQDQAQAIVNGLVARNANLQKSPVAVTFGDARGYQAITYYTTGQIIVSASHTASLEVILAHECGHIIDWRDNGTIDWGENIPVGTLYN